MKEKVRILLIDDDELQPVLVSQILNRIIDQKYELDWVADGAGAMVRFQSHQYDVSLVDYILEDATGVEVVEQAISQGVNLPFIMLTSKVERNVDLQSMYAGAVDFLVKTSLNEDLLERSIRYAIDRKQKENMILQQQRQSDAEMDHARKVQQALLPETLPTFPEITIARKYMPMEKIGGDFYDVFEPVDECVGFLLGDVTGHGIPAALISFMIYSLFKDSAVGIDSPEIVMNYANGRIEGKLPDSKFATMIYGMLDRKTLRFTFANAGHPPIYIIRSTTKELIVLDEHGPIIGVFPHTTYREISYQLGPGDKVLMYTDGILEVEGANKKILGASRLKIFLAQNSHLPIQELLDELHNFGLDYSVRDSFDDDVLLMGLEILKS